MKEIKEKRIGNLMFRKATYLGNEPDIPDWDIDYYYPNIYYGKEKDFIKDDRSPDFYLYPNSHNARIHKDCFKHKEACFTIACFVYDKHEGFYNIKFIGDRPMNLTEEEWMTFRKLLKYGNEVLNTEQDEVY
jgi:hypothetical protein